MIGGKAIAKLKHEEYECNVCGATFCEPSDTNDYVEVIVSDGKDCCPYCKSTDISQCFIDDSEWR